MTKSRGIRVRRGIRAAWLHEQQGRHFCQCGCGEPVRLRAEHFTLGVPRFVLGHNAKLSPPNKLPPKPRTLCHCGCGEQASPGRRYISGHNARGKRLSAEHRRRLIAGARKANTGRKPPNYKGGRTRHVGGYIQVHSPGHPFGVGPSRYVMEHRLVMEAHLRETDPDSAYLVEIDGELYLRPEIECHHVDGVRDNNAVENLRLLTKAEHARLHSTGNRRALRATERQEKIIRRMAGTTSLRAIGRAAGVTHHTVRRVLGEPVPG